MSEVGSISKYKTSSVALVLLDGWGIAPPDLNNLFAQTSWPNLYGYLQQYPLTALKSLADQQTTSQAYWQIGQGQSCQGVPGLGPVAGQSGLTSLIDQAGLTQVYFTETENISLVVNSLANGYEGDQVSYQLVGSLLNNDYSQNSLAVSRLVIDQAVKYWRKNQPDFMTVSLAGWDLVSRYGNLESVARAVTEMDKLLPKLINPLSQLGATIVLSSAFGRLESLTDQLIGEINRQASTNPVPMVIIGQKWLGQSIGEDEVVVDDLSIVPITGTLQSITPTVLALLGIDRPDYLSSPLLPTNYL